MKQSLDACRWVYNKSLEVRKIAWEERRENVTRYDTMKLIPVWKLEQPFLNNAFSQCLQESCTRLDLAFKAFFRRVKAGDTPGYPRFKSYHRYDSFTYPQSGFALKDSRLWLSKIGEVKIKLHRPIEGEVKSLTIRRDGVGNWYACFSCIVEPKPLAPSPHVVGIDLGLSKLATLSDGRVFKRERFYKQDERDIARLQRKKEKLVKGSPERRKGIHALNHAFQRQTSRRTNMAHQISRQLVNGYQVIVFEDLNILGMQGNGNKTINRGIADVAWARLVQFTTSKAEDAGRSVILVDPRNTTKQCSGCGEIVPKELHVRVHNCPACGLSLDRDLNAALNILSRGLATIRGIAPVEAALL